MMTAVSFGLDAVKMPELGKLTNKNKRERLVIDTNQATIDLIDELKDRTGVATRAELLRNMLRFTAAYLDELSDGSKPFWINKDGNEYTANGIPRIILLDWRP
ncbi:MAG: hypothetical protein V9G98_11935 [Candidatus Competibacter sp.]|jgi:hypothetical protein